MEEPRWAKRKEDRWVAVGVFVEGGIEAVINIRGKSNSRAKGNRKRRRRRRRRRRSCGKEWL